MAERVAVGVQIRQDTFDTRTLTFTGAAPVAIVTPRAERRVSAVFAEARIPLVGPENASPGLRSLELSIAGRYEDYDDFGSTTNPKLGVVWSPVRDLALRASWGTSFRAASLPQIHDASVLSLTTVPRGDGGSVLALYQYGGNADLKPETAETFTIGFDYRPRGRLNVSAGYFDTRFTDRIAQPATENLAGVLTDPALAPFVTRVSPGSNAADLALVQSYISRPDFAFGTLYPATSYGAIIDGRWVNTGAVRVNGFDLSARYPLAVGEHRITLDGSASYVLGYESQTTPDRFGSRGRRSDRLSGPAAVPHRSRVVQRRLERGSPLESWSATTGIAWVRVSTPGTPPTFKPDGHPRPVF